MLPTFVIGLREGLEAALIVGIIAAFLRKQGRKDLLRWMFAGVAAAVLFCLTVGIVLKLVSQDLPVKQQEGMETVIGVLAVGMVTYMVVWMRRHSRDLKGQLEGLASEALDGSSRAGRAMVLMAFLAVLREGIETVVFLLATFNESKAGAAGPIGAVLGLAVAVGLGYGIYRGGVRLNLSKFFRATGLVLVFVAAGLVVNALHTAHEAGWLNSGQATTLDLTWLVRPGSVQASLLTGMLGIQPRPVVIETIGWLLYLIPVGLYVAWPPGKGLARRTTARLLVGAGAITGLAAVAIFTLMPARPNLSTTAASVDGVTVAIRPNGEVTATRDGAVTVLTRIGVARRDGLSVEVWHGHTSAPTPGTQQVSYSRIAGLNSGRLPIGVHPAASGVGTLAYSDVLDYSAYVEPRTGQIVEIAVARNVLATLIDSGRRLPLSDPVSHSGAATPVAAVNSATEAAARGRATIEDRSTARGFGWLAGVLSALALLAGILLRPKRLPKTDEPHTVSRGSLVNS